MAEMMVIVVPKNPDYLPARQSIDAAVALLERFFPDRETEVRYETVDRPKFVTSRDAFEWLRCPECGDRLRREYFDKDAEGGTWWDRFVERLHGSADPRREVLEMPCCGAKVQAGKLGLGTDAAFARLSMWIHGPNGGEEITDEQAQALSRALGCEVLWMTGVQLTLEEKLLLGRDP